MRAESVTATLVYTYNAAGLRVAQSVDGNASTYAWDWATGVPELLSDGDARYLVGHDTLGWDDGAGWRYALPDALGSVRHATDSAGVVVAAREPVLSVAEGWTPYGVEVGDAQAGLGFTGEWFDAAVGLQYLRARWYDPGAGRFTQPDTLMSTVTYNYTSNNPVNRVDPSGYIDWTACQIQGDRGTCIVQTGDTLYKIAREINAAGVSTAVPQLVAEMLALNPQIIDPNYIRIGDPLRLQAGWIAAIIQSANVTTPPAAPAPYLPGPTPHSWDPAVDILRQLGGVNDLEALARIADAYAQLYPDWASFLSQMSTTFLGVKTFGPGTLVHAALATSRDGCIGLGREPDDCLANTGKPYFLDTGFHQDYRDTHNQPYHVWGFIAETAFPFDLKHAADGVCIAYAGNIFHDIIQSRRILNHHEGYGASWQDYYLSLAGIEIGTAISSGAIAAPRELSQVLRERLGPAGPGSRGAVQWWEEHWDIKPLK